MDIKNWNGKKKVLAILGGLLAIVGLVVTVFLVDRVQDLRGRAEKSTTISLTPPSQTISAGEDAKLDVVLNPGTNQVNFVKFTIKFDPDKFDPSLTVFNVDPNSPLRAIGGSSFTSYDADNGTVTFTVDVGSDPTKVVRGNPVTVGTLLVPSRDDSTGTEQISFDEANTQVRSINATDAFNENVLLNTVPATVTITGGVCVENVGFCSWDPSENATSYHYIVTDTEDNSVVEEGDVDSDTTQIDFPTEDGKTYKCEVVAKNECGESSPSEGESTCEIPSVTPTPSKTGTPTPSKTGTPTPSKTGTPTPSPSDSPTPTKKPTSTPTPTTPGGATNTPTPTTPQGGAETPTPTFTPTPTPVEIVVSTPIPTLPPTGNPVVITGLIGGFLFLLGGLALLFL